MSRSRYIFKNARGVSPHIKRALRDEALEREITMGDVIGLVLVERLGGEYEPSGERSIGVDLNGAQLRFQIPKSLGLKIYYESRRTKQTESSVILGILAEHYGLIHEPVRKGRKRAAEAA